LTVDCNFSETVNFLAVVPGISSFPAIATRQKPFSTLSLHAYYFLAVAHLQSVRIPRYAKSASPGIYLFPNFWRVLRIMDYHFFGMGYPIVRISGEGCKEFTPADPFRSPDW
jgi:hypothetical protein